MTKKRVHEIAKEQGMSSADVLTKLRAAGIDVTAAASTVDEAEALRALVGNGAAPAKPAVARPAGFGYFQRRVPGVPLRSTPGFMLTPASRVEPIQILHVGSTPAWDRFHAELLPRQPSATTP